MCGRFNILTDAETLMETFTILQGDVDFDSFDPRYNISPSVRQTEIDATTKDSLTRVPMVELKPDGRRQLTSAIWPLIPFWAETKVPKYATANARSESMTERSSYRSAWKRSQRCLIPATGFYEWQSVAGLNRKQPWHIRHQSQPVMGFAGLWEKGKMTDGTPFKSCTIVTTEANALMAKIHNSNYRMPVIVDPDHWDQWLGGDHDAALALAVSYPDGQLQADPISTRINNPHYNHSDCLEPVELAN